MAFTLSAMKTLAEYMTDTETKDAELAIQVNCDRSMITKLRRRQATPSLKLALAINKVTGVSVEMLMPEATQ